MTIGELENRSGGRETPTLRLPPILAVRCAHNILDLAADFKSLLPLRPEDRLADQLRDLHLDRVAYGSNSVHRSG